jgi:hypothetical protein
MSLPDFHTFREMLEHLETGGAAWRYGTNYPIYYRGSWGGVEKRVHGGSSGECIEGMGPGSGISFSVEEQNSINWVLMSAENWKKREDDMRAAWERIREENRSRQIETGVYEGKVGQIVPRDPPKKERGGWWNS